MDRSFGEDGIDLADGLAQSLVRARGQDLLHGLGAGEDDLDRHPGASVADLLDVDADRVYRHVGVGRTVRVGKAASRSRASGLRARSAVKHRPADVVPQPLVVKYELANRLRELVALPLALELPCGLALSFGRGSTRGLDRIGGRTKLVRGDVGDNRRLAGSERGIPCCPTQVSGRAHCVATRRASLGHPDLATHPGAGLLNRMTRSRVLRLGRLEEVKDVLRARCRPEREEMVIRISEGPAAADRHEARVAVFREDHTHMMPPSPAADPASADVFRQLGWPVRR